MNSLKQVAAGVMILDECGVFGGKRKNRKKFKKIASSIYDSTYA
jgi:hypothetical protein